MKKLIKIENTWYVLLGMYGGIFHVSRLLDINNGVVKSGVIWEYQPFFYENEFWYGRLLRFTVQILRFMKQLIFKDVFGKRLSKFPL